MDSMVWNGMTTEHTDERSIVSNTDIHDDETVVAS